MCEFDNNNNYKMIVANVVVVIWKRVLFKLV